MALKERIKLYVSTIIISIMAYVMKDYSVFLAVILAIAAVLMILLIIVSSIEPDRYDAYMEEMERLEAEEQNKGI